MMIAGSNSSAVSGEVSRVQQQQQQSRGAKDKRLPQWSYQETKDLIAIRGELEMEFKLSKRTKNLWEMVAGKMREKGYVRTPDQCKGKWKTLVNRYKGQEASDSAGIARQMNAVFTEPFTNMQLELTEAESGPSHSNKKLKTLSGDRSTEDVSEDENDDADGDHEPVMNTKKRKGYKGQQRQQQRSDNPRSIISSIHDLLQDFFQQQQRMEIQWQEMMEKKAQQRLMCEQEWRQSMEKLEKERLMLEKAWWEKEEQRRIREESRAEKRDALLNTLLTKLVQDNF